MVVGNLVRLVLSSGDKSCTVGYIRFVLEEAGGVIVACI